MRTSTVLALLAAFASANALRPVEGDRDLEIRAEPIVRATSTATPTTMQTQTSTARPEATLPGHKVQAPVNQGQDGQNDQKPRHKIGTTRIGRHQGSKYHEKTGQEGKEGGYCAEEQHKHKLQQGDKPEHGIQEHGTQEHGTQEHGTEERGTGEHGVEHGEQAGKQEHSMDLAKRHSKDDKKDDKKNDKKEKHHHDFGSDVKTGVKVAKFASKFDI